MKKLLKILLPPSIAFAVFFVAVRYSPYYFELKPDAMGNGNLQSFMSYYRYVLPLIFVTGLLTQVLIFKPIWDKVIEKSWGTKLITFAVICLVCFLLAAFVAYAMWDNYSRKHLIKLCLFMTGVQMLYWMMDIVMMYFIDGKRIQTKEEADIKPLP